MIVPNRPVPSCNFLLAQTIPALRPNGSGVAFCDHARKVPHHVGRDLIPHERPRVGFGHGASVIVTHGGQGVTQIPSMRLRGWFGIVKALARCQIVVLIRRERKDLFALLFLARRDELVMESGEGGGGQAGDLGRAQGRLHRRGGRVIRLPPPNAARRWCRGVRLEAGIVIDIFEHHRRRGSDFVRHPRDGRRRGRGMVGRDPGTAEEQHEEQARRCAFLVFRDRAFFFLRQHERGVVLGLGVDAEVVGHGEVIPRTGFHGQVFEIGKVGGIAGRARHGGHGDGVEFVGVLQQGGVLLPQIARVDGMPSHQLLFLQRHLFDVALHLLVRRHPPLLLSRPLGLPDAKVLQRLFQVADDGAGMFFLFLEPLGVLLLALPGIEPGRGLACDERRRPMWGFRAPRTLPVGSGEAAFAVSTP